MADHSVRARENPRTAPTAGSDRVVVVVPEVAATREDGVDLIATWLLLWRHKWLIVSITTTVAVLSIVYALTLTHWYRAEMLLAPATEDRVLPDLARQLGGFASLAGISVGGKGNAEPLAVLQSRDFIRGFIEEHKLLTVLFAEEWDSTRGAWKAANPEDWPDMREAVKFFSESVLTVEEERGSGLVTVAVEWTDPQMAAQWVTSLVKRLNETMRAAALLDAQRNVDFLRKEMGATELTTLQQSIGRLLETEMQKLMLARGNEEFAFRILDSAEVPRSPSRPSRTLIVVLSTMLGGVLAVFVVLIRQAVSSHRVIRAADSVDGESAPNPVEQ